MSYSLHNENAYTNKTAFEKNIVLLNNMLQITNLEYA